jgi:hypothetical protein
MRSSATQMPTTANLDPLAAVLRLSCPLVRLPLPDWLGDQMTIGADEGFLGSDW